MRLILLLFAAVAILPAPVAVADDGWENSEVMVRRLELRRGARVVQIGPSSNLVDEIAAAIGPSGHLYLFDADESVVRGLRQVITSQKLLHVSAEVIGSALPANLDAIIVANNTRQLRDDAALLRIISRSLQRSGRVVVIDFYRRPMKVGPPTRDRVASHDALKLMTRHGFRLKRRIKANSYQYVFIFAKK